MSILRPYQEKAIVDLRLMLRNRQSALLQMITGSGKTVLISSIINSSVAKGNTCWFVVPRNELLRQASKHFTKWNISHGFIKAGQDESRAYKVHIISKDTLIRRIKQNKIKQWPDLLCIDECHMAIKQQIFIASHISEKCKIIGLTATPARLSGEGLGRCLAVDLINKASQEIPNYQIVKQDGLYQGIIYGPTMQDLIELGYLSKFKYFSPPIEGLEKLHRKGTEYDEDELLLLLEKRKVYGDAINHYRMYADKKPCIVFCRSIKASKETAQRFCEAGYKFEDIDGSMSEAKRKAILQGLENGTIHGITSVDLVIVGLDIPIVSCVIFLRPTLSRTVYMQAIGRGLRTAEGKDYCVILDHVGNLKEHGYPLDPYEWAFYGREKRKKGQSAATLKCCPKCFMYYDGSVCPNCHEVKEQKAREGLEVVDGRLVEVQSQIVKLKDRPYEERREYTDQISNNILRYKDAEKLNPDPEAIENIRCEAVENLLKLARDLGRPPISVYYQLNRFNKVVDVPLLHLIRRICNYKPGWAYMQKKQIEERMGR